MPTTVAGGAPAEDTGAARTPAVGTQESGPGRQCASTQDAWFPSYRVRQEPRESEGQL